MIQFDGVLAEQAALDAMELNRLRRAIAATGDGVWEWALDQATLDASPRCAELLGWTPSELGTAVSAWIELVHPAERALARKALVAHMRGETRRFEQEVRLRQQDGSWRWTMLRGSVDARHPNGRARSLVGTLTDAAPQRKALDEMRQEVESAHAACREKSEFLASLGHEIRTPMIWMLGMTERLLNQNPTAEQREHLQALRSSGEVFSGVINDLLELSKIEAGLAVLDPVGFSLRDCVDGVCRTVAPSAHRRGVEVTCTIAPEVCAFVEGDPTRLHQILLQLLTYAIRGTVSGEVALTVSVKACAGDQTTLVFSLPDPAATVAQRFASLHPPAPFENTAAWPFGGTGLGLTIAARLAALMGDSIAVRNAPDGTSMLVLESTFGVGAIPGAAAPESFLRGLRLLVVDDRESNRALCQQVMKAWGSDVAVAASGTEALALIEEADAAARPFAVVLLDEEMPGMDGPAVAKALRTRAARPALILATLMPRAVVARRAEAEVFSEWLTKPFSAHSLHDAVAVCVRRVGAKSAIPATVDEGNPFEPAERPLRVLVAEDDPVTQLLMRRQIERLGHTVTIVSNGQECLAAWEHGAFDMIVMDIQMPVLSGIEATRAIRRAEAVRGGHIQIIALTAYATSNDESRCRGAGMDNYLAKPIHIEAVAAALETRGAVQAQWLAANGPGAVLDEAAFLSGLDGDIVLAVQLGQIFFGLSEQLLRSIQANWDRRDLDGLRQSVHSLTGSLATFTLGTAYETATRIERTALQGEFASVTEEDLARLARETRQLVVALRAFVARHGTLAASP